MDIHCPKCGTEFELAEEDKGRKVLCPCGLKFIAEEPADVPAKPARKPATRRKSAPPSPSGKVPTAKSPAGKPSLAPATNATAPALRGTASRLTTSVTLTRPIPAKQGQRILLVALALLIGVLLAVLVYMIMKG
jgi:uncharacterized Zn finger protein (UPF0148 family)